MLPLPGSPASSWAIYKSKFKALFQGADTSVLIAFWLFGLINNVSYVIILSAALDLVGPNVPKGVVLLADVLPSFLTKLVAPYFIHRIPYSLRIIIMCALSAAGMFLIALTPSVIDDNGSISIKLFGVAIASLSSGAGELSLLGLTHYYGPFSLAAWGSGTGGAGLIGAGLYVLLTSTIGMTIRNSLLTCAFLPFIMPVAFFLVLPQGPLRRAQSRKDYEPIPRSFDDDDIQNLPVDTAADALLAPGPSIAAEAYSSHSPRSRSPSAKADPSLFTTRLRRARALFFPYMLPLLLVYIAEYTINQGISPTLLFPIASSPFTTYRSFYPTYAFLYQLGVFISRSSSPFIRLHNLYLPSFLQIGNLVFLGLHSMFFFLPSVWVIFAVVLWEGLLGGAVYVNTFAEIMDKVEVEEREFSLGATSVSDSAGICIASLLGMVIEPWLCGWNVERGRGWCRTLDG
ncbi:protein btn-1 [Mollisia scopiformis]|uniref:Protein BTN n=1 Tax=Mollisia scopiformis TaxID=149040 RepID=A0A194WZX7_MOLSC|nr:protein btn-1 [Mollisia scopiformis]KUJ13500.1 protein btn-1 [Mollisia scopiformis]